MGVPKFFRYTSERYPCLNELVKQYQIPEFDNMYLDMNGIIHNCSHPDDSNAHFRITEEKIFKDIFHYISILFQIIKPKKLFFMAIDGVAPRAKMNQQRGRRFRSAREAEKLEEAAKGKGEVLPTEKRFDSNCITPGTVFMARLHEQLKYFIKEKISTDPLWSKVQVILSGHETPGEGEHKIMDYIRWSRSQPEYDPATRHCLYGLDADLIMLGLCTHEPHFALLREEVKFGKTTQHATSPEETNFYLLHLCLLREYLEQEFITIKDKLPFPYDIEKIVDDWVLMGFLVGNDFIPNLPNMHISNDALPVLYNTYMTVLPTLDGYINEAGDLHLGRFEIFMQELAKIDKEKFQDTYADLKYFEAKTGRRPNTNERREYKPNNDDTFNVNLDDIKANKPDDELQALIDATQEMFMEDMKSDDEYEDISDEEANIEMEFILHKKDYYMNKLDYLKVTDEVLSDQAECYVRAIQWNLWYYYRGCPSWCWYYPHHYAPYISDVKDFGDMKMEFELGEPFKPFEQLLAVLPGASKHLLPTPFHDLMTDEDSPIVHYYPVDFTTDLNGKKNDWEAVVLLPFIDETNLLSAMAPCYQRLTEEELRRNSHGPMLVYNWTSENLGPITAPEFFSSIKINHATEKRVWRNELDVPLEQLKRGLLPNANKDILYPGFPTMRHLKYRTSLKKCKVKVFDQPSRNESMIVEILPTEADPLLEDFARSVLGKVIWVGWPHLTRAKVISVSNEKMRLHHVNTLDSDKVHFTIEMNTGNLHQQWISERSTIIEHNMNRLGIELGEVKVIIHAVNLRGYKYIVQDNCRMVAEEQWCSVSCGYATQAIVLGSTIPPPPAPRDPAAAYPPGDDVFLVTAGQYYGCMATVVSSEALRSGRIKVSVRECSEPVPSPPAAAAAYRNAHHAAAACGISNQLLSRITGTVLVIPGERNDLPTETQNKINVGLNLKFNKKNQEVSGYSRRCLTAGSWLYSPRCVSLVRSYAAAYPELFDALSAGHRDVFFESDLWPADLGKNKLQDIAAWLKSQPHINAARRECGSEALEPEEMKALYNNLRKQTKELEGTEQNVTLHVKWSLLYKSDLNEGIIQPDLKADYKMYDRVVCVSKNMTVPLGAKGTITAIYQPSNNNTVRLSDKLNATPSYQVMFDRPFPGAMMEELFEEGRFYRMQPTHLLNISYGRKIRNLSMEPFEYSRSTHQDNFNSFSTNQKQSTPTPTTLRRSDGHHSAFASYSPPREIKTPVAENNSNINNNIKNDPPDNATCLLRSLLRISEGETEGSKKNKNVPDPNTNWRSKNDNRPPSPTKTTQNNWRKENNSYSQSEWSQPQKKQQQPIGMPAIPYPTFAGLPRPPLHQPHHQPQHQPQPHPQLHHQFQSQPHHQLHPQPHPHPQPHHPPYQPQPHNQPRYQSHQTNQVFPKHLPDVSQGIALMPAWSRGENLKSVHVPSQTNVNQQTNNGEKYSNPFVPLQVQTSQRRVQNTVGPPQRRELEGLVAPKVVHSNNTTLFNPQQQASRPQRKKKPRIAANLPFQMD